MLTWREDVWIEADIKRCVADGANGLAGVEDHFTAFGVCVSEGPPSENVKKQ